MASGAPELSRGSAQWVGYPIWDSAFHPMFEDDVGQIFYVPRDAADPSIKTETLALTFEIYERERGSSDPPVAFSHFPRGTSDTIVQRRRLPARAASVAPKLHNAILCLHRDDPLRRAYIRRRWMDTTSRNLGCGWKNRV